MIKSRRGTALLMLVVVGLVLAGCAAPAAPPSPSAATTPSVGVTPRPAATPTSRLERVLVGSPATSLDFIPLIVGIQKGIFKEEGIDAVEQIIKSDIAVAGLMAKEIDYMTAVGSTSRAAVRGIPLRVIIFTLISPYQAIYARAGINTVEDLRGKKLAVSGLFATTATFAREVLKRHGMDGDKDLVMVVLDNPLAISALQAGSVDAWVAAPPQDGQVRKLGYKLVTDVTEVVLPPGGGLGTTAAKIKENPQQVKKMLKGSLRSMEYIRNNRAEMVKLVAKHFELDEEISGYSLDSQVKIFTKAGIPSEAGIKLLIDDAKRTANVKEEVPVDRVVDLSILKEVQAELKIGP
ncbi:MAG: ABC transporter substrate-binding protein [Chloroflexi bacterium]|nr:ABC transporter substrate-binding protein [Chloroflexota bacterium]